MAIIFLYAFNASKIEAWPIEGLTLTWITVTINDAGIAARGSDGPGCERVPDVSRHHAAVDLHVDHRRCDACVRSFVRRDHRHDLHRGGAEHAADLDLCPDPKRPAVARSERGGFIRHPGDDYSGPHRRASHWW